jgi:DNA-directed RNA polymerase subunit RPC12/RpoP
MVVLDFDERVIGVLIAALGYCGYLLFACRRHWKDGCVNPGVVISTEPFMVAVVTDMSMYPDDFSSPALKIVGGREPPEGVEVGDRLATVAMYKGSSDSDTWSDFDPQPTYTATNDPAQLRQMIDSIADWEWRALDDAVKQVTAPQKAAIYNVDIDFEEYARAGEASSDGSLKVPGFVQDKPEQGYEQQPEALGHIRFACSACGQAYKVSQKYAGKAVRCRKCAARIVVPV